MSGDSLTIALLLGLKPVQYWANSTATWRPSDALLRVMPDGDQIGAVLSRPVVIWKPIDTSGLQFDPKELAKLVFNLYLKIFSDESFAKKFSGLGSQDPASRQKQPAAYDLYTRGSLAAMPKCMKEAGVVDWSEFISCLIKDCILNDSTLNMDPHHFQSLLAHLHGLSLSNLDQFLEWWHPSSFADDLQGPLGSWSNMPSTVPLTMVVPRSKVSMFDDLNKNNGTPLCEIQIHSNKSSKQATFSDIQLGFGTVRSSGKPFTTERVLSVVEDTTGWKGSSPLIVSAIVPTSALFEYCDTAGKVVFMLKSTPAAMMSLASKLGMFLILHQSAVGQEDVFVTRYRPNMQRHVSVGSASTSTPLEGQS